MSVNIASMSKAYIFGEDKYIKIKSREDSYTLKVKEDLGCGDRIVRFFSNLFGTQYREISKVLNTDEGQASIAKATKKQLSNLAAINLKIKKLNKRWLIPNIQSIQLPKGVIATAPVQLKKFNSNDLLITFYEGIGKDVEGRTLEDIWNFSLEKKESAHNYIQWLFPSETKSQFNSTAPVLTSELIGGMNNETIISNLKTSLNVMLEFYGLKWDDGHTKIELSDTFVARSNVWLKKGDHNHLRLTRIMKCLLCFELIDEKKALFNCLKAIKAAHPDRIADTTWNIWKKV